MNSKRNHNDSKSHGYVPDAIQEVSEELRAARNNAIMGKGTWNSVYRKKRQLMKLQRQEKMGA